MHHVPHRYMNEWPHFTVTHAIHRTKSINKISSCAYNSKFNSMLNASRYLNRTYFMSKTYGNKINKHCFAVYGPMSATLSTKCSKIILRVISYCNKTLWLDSNNDDGQTSGCSLLSCGYFIYYFSGCPGPFNSLEKSIS